MHVGMQSLPKHRETPSPVQILAMIISSFRQLPVCLLWGYGVYKTIYRFRFVACHVNFWGEVADGRVEVLR